MGLIEAGPPCSGCASLSGPAAPPQTLQTASLIPQHHKNELTERTQLCHGVQNIAVDAGVYRAGMERLNTGEEIIFTKDERKRRNEEVKKLKEGKRGPTPNRLAHEK